MAEVSQEVTLEFEPALVPEDQIIVPLQKVTTIPELPFAIVTPAAGVKGLILNIETDGYNPWENRIIAIAFQDPLNPERQPSVIMLDDEELMIEALITVIAEGAYTHLIGYGIGFDYRFIIVKALYYQLDCKEFFDCDLIDLMESIAKGRARYVYMAQKPPSLSDLADYLWGYPKPFTDTEMIKFWRLGDHNKVLEFASSQVTRILALYVLYVKVTTTSITAPVSGIEGAGKFSAGLPPTATGSPLTIPEASAPGYWVAKCPNDLSEWNVPVSQTSFVCPIDKTIIRRGAD